jgi:A/G-specific adenine glycosylase
MAEVPTTDWTHEFDENAALRSAPRFSSNSAMKHSWRRLPGTVSHAFTHFPLRLAVYAKQVAKRTPAPAGMRWVARAVLADQALPTVMRKVLTHAGCDAAAASRPPQDQTSGNP